MNSKGRIFRLLSDHQSAERRENYFYELSADKELLEWFKQFKRNHKVFQPESPSKFNMVNPNKDSDGATGDLTSPQDACQAAGNLSQERESRDAALAKQVVEAIAREMAKAHVHHQALLNERGATAMPTGLKMTSGALGFKVMDPFDWTKDKAIYQRWQMWSEKARHALDAMESDSEKTKISYFHHWIDSEGMAKIESWKIKKILISQANYEKLEENEKKASTPQKR